MARARVLLLAAILCVTGCKRTRTEKQQIAPPTPGQQASAAGFQPPIVTVSITSVGFVVRVREVNVAPGCNEMGSGVAVANTDGKKQFMALRICMEKLKAHVPGLDVQSSAVLQADPSTPYADVIETMDAMRATMNGQKVFPDIVFGTDADGGGAGAIVH